MEVPYTEGLANRSGPESCGGGREDAVEALTGGSTGQPLSRERNEVSGADSVQVLEGNTDGCVNASVHSARRGRRTWHVQKLFEREPGDLGVGRRSRAGPHWEDEESKPVMNDPKKSDLGIVAAKRTNKADGNTAAESVEPRPGTEGNVDQQSMHRAQNRTSHVTGAGPRTSSRVKLDVKHPRWEPSALMGHARICAGGAQQCASLPRTALMPALWLGSACAAWHRAAG